MSTTGNADVENGDVEPVTFSKTIKTVIQLFTKLSGQNVKTPAAVKMRDEVCEKMDEVIQAIKSLRAIHGDDPSTSIKATIDEVSEYIKAEIKAEINEASEDIKAEIKALGDTMKDTKERT
jgi:gas vesicle protein